MFEVEDFEIENCSNKNKFVYNTNTLDGDINCMAIDNNKKILYCGGNFKKTVNNDVEIILNNICKITLNDEPQLVSNLGLGLNSFVNCMVVDLIGNLYVGGNFTFVGGILANYIAKWDGENWYSLANGLSSIPYSMIIDINNDLIVGGTFVLADNEKVNYIAKWNGEKWTSLGDGVNGNVTSLCINKLGELFVGGYFTTENKTNLELNYIGKYSNDIWSKLSTGLEAPVTCMSITDTSYLFVGGYFANNGGIAMKHICGWNGTNWCQLGSGLNAAPKCLINDNEKLYIGGCFTNVGGCNIKFIVKWNIIEKKWRQLDNALNSNINNMIIDSMGILYVSGSFEKRFRNNSTIKNTKLAKWKWK